MAKQTGNPNQKSEAIPNQSSQRDGQQPRPGDTADAASIDRLEAISGGADEDDPRFLLDPDLSREVDKLDAATEEEVDALRVNLAQDGGESHTTDSSGRVVDDAAEEEIARFTEVGPMQPDQGVVSVEPGRMPRIFSARIPAGGSVLKRRPVAMTSATVPIAAAARNHLGVIARACAPGSNRADMRSPRAA